METISRYLLTFLLNSLWQIPLAAVVAALACRLMRNGPAGHRHAVWVAALLAAILLPLASVRTGAPGAQLQLAAPAFSQTITVPAAGKPSAPASVSTAPLPGKRTVSFAQTTAAVLVAAYLLFVLFRLALLARASMHTVSIRQTAGRAAAPRLLQDVWARCLAAFGLARVDLLCSAEVSGPVTAGRTIVLPGALFAEGSRDVLTTAIGHEMAHIARRDFVFNILYELLYLPVSFHPAAWLIQRGIEQTREIACDELVTHKLLDAGVYARSIMTIATGMTALPRPGYTLGVFDGDILEERIRRLIERPAANLKRARLLLATGLAALAVCAVIASSLALTALAQGGAYSLIKQGEAAYHRGDYREALLQFDSAVRIEPGNLKARLLLANTLLREYVPGSDTEEGRALVDRARRQYLDVLAQEPRNQSALQGMMILHTNTKQFPEAHEWALKAIQADPADKSAYYTAGFVDWVMTYPDYADARKAAGMNQWDSGIIPDAALRQGVRTQHGAQIEDGLRMLQVAIQLDPDYSDAMAYMNLLYRIQAGIADSPAQYADFIAKADDWVDKALAAKRRRAQNPPAGQPLSVDSPSVMVPAPPPPPPPPPPPAGQLANGDAQQRIAVNGREQQARLLSQTAPVYPQQARQAGRSGVVQLAIVIGKDGKVQNIRILRSAGIDLDTAAMEAVKTWVYEPVLLSGQTMEVATTVEVNFTAR